MNLMKGIFSSNQVCMDEQKVSGKYNENAPGDQAHHSSCYLHQINTWFSKFVPYYSFVNYIIFGADKANRDPDSLQKKVQKNFSLYNFLDFKQRRKISFVSWNPIHIHSTYKHIHNPRETPFKPLWLKIIAASLLNAVHSEFSFVL